MDCTQYQNWLADEALDGLSPARSTELRSHLVACADCRSELERRRLFLNAMDQAVAASSAGEPSPAFAPRVRERLAEQPAPAANWLAGWMPWTAGAVAIAALLVFWLFPKESSSPATQPTPQVVTKTNPAPSGGEPTPPTVSTPRKAASTQMVRATAPATPAAAEILIPPEQRAGIAWLSDALRRRPTQTTALLADFRARAELQAEPLRIEERKIPALEIPPVEKLTGSERSLLN